MGTHVTKYASIMQLISICIATCHVSFYSSWAEMGLSSVHFMSFLCECFK